MSKKKGLFAILNDGNGAGVGIDLVNPDTTLGSAIDNTLAAPSFIDSSGVLVFPQLDSEGKLPVTFDTSGVCLYNSAKVIGSTSFQDLGSVSAQVDKMYTQFNVSISAMTEACIRLIYDDNGTEEVLAEYMLGPGQYSYCCKHDCLEKDTSGKIGTQVFKLQGKLLESTGSEISGFVSFKEIVN